MKIKKNTFTISWGVLSIFLLNFITVLPSQAQKAPDDIIEQVDQTIVIHNVTFVDPKSADKSTTAKLVITNKLFDLVTQDDVKVLSSDIIFDGEGGFVLGSLESGKIANFMILDADPHKSIEALLDTKKHILLAISEGVIIRNNLKTFHLKHHQYDINVPQLRENLSFFTTKIPQFYFIILNQKNIKGN